MLILHKFAVILPIILVFLHKINMILHKFYVIPQKNTLITIKTTRNRPLSRPVPNHLTI